MARFIGGPVDGKEIDLKEPSYRVIFPELAMPFEAVYIPEGVPMWKTDAAGVEYHYCNDGKYRRTGTVNHVYERNAAGEYVYVSQPEGTVDEFLFPE